MTLQDLIDSLEKLKKEVSPTTEVFRYVDNTGDTNVMTMDTDLIRGVSIQKYYTNFFVLIK